MALLTETANYDEGGSWARMSDGWPGIKGADAVAMYTFANCVRSIPYGSYVLISERGKYKATESYLRVHANHIVQLKRDFKRAGRPSCEVSIARRKRYGRKNEFGNHLAVPVWTA